MHFVFHGPTAPEGGRQVAPFQFRASDIPHTPEGRLQRLTRAAIEAFPVAMALRKQTLAQMDEGADVVLLVCAVDCPLGRQIVERRFGPLAAIAACGVFVFALTPTELAGSFGPQGSGVLAQLQRLDVEAGDVVWVFAVNGMQGLQLEPRVMRVELSNAAPPVEAQLEEPAPAPAPPSASSAAAAAPGERTTVLDEHAPAEERRA